MQFIAKDSTCVTIREACAKDALALIAYLNIVGGETDFLTFGHNEFFCTEEKEILYINSMNTAPNNCFLLAEIDGEIAGVVSLDANTKKRLAHNSELGITVRKKYWGIGIGNALLSEILCWAKQNAVTKNVNLVVVGENISAISLYEKHNFRDTGIYKNYSYVNGKYYDAKIMNLSV